MIDQQRPVDERYYALLHQLQAIDFVLVELTLYLDTHKNDMDAINQYNQYAQERWRIRQQFESLYGPLMHYGQSCTGYPWQWADEPWPWQV